MVGVNRVFHDQEILGGGSVGAALGHRNTLPPAHHVPVGISSKAVSDFEELQIHHGTDMDNPVTLAKLFPTEDGSGWHGYVEWEKEPERCAKAAIILASKAFTPIPDFQSNPLPTTNPILLGERWKEYHLALGPSLENLPEESWKIAQEEKSKDMLTVLDFPLNMEPRREQLMHSHITPNELFYVRNHGGIPSMKQTEDYKLEVGGLVKNPGTLTLAQLQDPELFKQISMPVTLQCCGTRRVEQIACYPGEGDELLSAPWAEGAIGTAVWGGVSLKSVLKHFGGITQDFVHVEAIGADTYFKKGKVYNYAVSVPYTKVKVHEVMVAFSMNGKPLPKSHGAPVRLICTGYIGARSCKWLIRLNVLADPSTGPVQQKEYLYFNQQVGKHNSTYSRGFSIQAMPVSSALLFPADKAVVVHTGTISCSGWAYSGGSQNWIERVELSSDGGFTWYEVPTENLSPKMYNSMRLYHYDLPVASEGWIEIKVRAWDSACNTQPASVRDAWNWTLHVTSSSHSIKVYSANKSYKATADRIALLESVGDSLIPITRPIETVSTESAEAYAAAMAIRGPREPRC